MIRTFTTSFQILLLFVVNSSSLVFAQDIVTKKDGSNIEGTARILYQDLDDFILINDLIVPANEITSIQFESGKTFFSFQLYYYNTRLSEEIQKYAFLELILDGDAKLYNYKGFGFDFALSTRKKTQALQLLQAGLETNKIQNFKIELETLVGECVPKIEVLASVYKQNSLIYLVNKYNRCKDSSYKPFRIAQTKYVISSLSFSVGLNRATHSLRTIIPPGNNFVDQKNIQSNSPSFSAFFQKNLFNTQKLFFQLDASFRLLDFEVNSIENDISIENLRLNEMAIGIGFNYKFLPSKNISPEVTLGVYGWNFRGHTNVYGETSDRFPVLHSRYSQASGIGQSIQGAVRYHLRENTYLFVAGTYLRKNERNVFTNLVPDKLKEDVTDSFHSNYTITFGISFYTFKSGFF